MTRISIAHIVYSGPWLSEDVDKLIIATGTALLPDALLGTFLRSLKPVPILFADQYPASIKSNRKKAFSNLLDRIENVIETYLNYKDSDTFCGDSCRYRGMEIQFVFTDLIKRKLWPRHLCLDAHTFHSATEELRLFEDFDPDDCNCDTYSLGDEFRRVARRISESLCLSCVKQGRFSKKSGNCQSIYSSRCEGLKNMKRKRQDPPSDPN